MDADDAFDTIRQDPTQGAVNGEYQILNRYGLTFVVRVLVEDGKVQGRLSSVEFAPQEGWTLRPLNHCYYY